MICETPEDFTRVLPQFGAIAGLDLGTVTIGVAVSDSMRTIGSPLETIKRKKFGVDAAALLKLTTARDIHCLLYTSPSPRDLSTSRMPSSA